MLPVLFALCGALSNALATVLQHRAAQTVRRSEGFRFGLLLDLAHRPVWVAGIVAVTAAALFQAVALARGALSVVQPIFVLELPFALVISALMSRRNLPGQAWTAVACMVVGLGLALGAAAPTPGTMHVPMSRWIPALAGCGAAIAVLCTVALRRPPGGVRAACLAGAAAVGNALTAALIKSSTHLLDVHGLVAFLTAWQTYGFAIAGVGALYLLENALQSGPLVASQPALTLGDAGVSLLLGVLLYEETLRAGLWLIPETVGVALIVAGVLVLARTPLTRTLMAPAG
ncbi:DMT family transporter [Kitasatospora sp. NPDC051914]|uniref:DMT family transporter n=1 Tax=Kitasatospora sp. NPDC051914 TaxID=3154945 RepID=UPI00341E45EF